ncbi:hypothetical protein [Bacillus sp. FJAT-42315]|uniref:hypothetical protein n=1 Tax=Bacillus sp. FJAT-42315 TaxID=2014077 RepID=UPI000C23E41A|nr:hypothetical protein [Bacillus sp. FJAT-42315]
MKQKLTTILSLSYFIFMFGCFLFFWFAEDVYRYQIGLGGMIAGLVPIMIERFTRSSLKKPLVISYFIFLIGSQILGSLMRFYSLGWWDTFLHFLSGGLIAFAALELMDRLTTPASREGMSRSFVLLFLFSVSVLGGVFWEIYEFSADQLLGTTTQGGGNVDTMGDLIADSLGGLLVAIVIAFNKQ